MTRTPLERKQVRRLRYECFVEEEKASCTEEQKQLGEEYDSYDRFAEYMGVFHGEKLVGTYRIIDRSAAEKMGGFYTETEFDISKIKRVRGNIAEMSRAAVARDYRDNGLVMRLLWAGLGEYIAKKEVMVLFGVASFLGTRPVKSAHAISYLYYHHLAPQPLRATVESGKMADGVNPKQTRMNILPRAFVDEKDAFAEMPPLVKGYLRLGAKFGKGVFIDAPFNCHDVFVTVETRKISASYQKHFLGSENALNHLKVKDDIVKAIGKIMLFPVTGPFKAVQTFVQSLLRDSAADVEYIEEKYE